MKLWPVVTGVAIALTLVASKSPTPPKGVKPISNFEASRYLGKWNEVSFFGPFYGGYNVIKLDDKYQYALVSGPNRDYLWILSRTPTIPDAVKQDYLNTARSLGFKVDQLVWVKQ